MSTKLSARPRCFAYLPPRPDVCFPALHWAAISSLCFAGVNMPLPGALSMNMWQSMPHIQFEECFMSNKYACSAFVLAGLFSACTVVPPRVVVGGPAVVVTAPVAPPPPRVEVIPAPPSADMIWVPGYWHWDGGHHVWMGGRWEARRGHEHWEPHRWAPDNRGGWRLHGGYWRHD